MDDHISASLEAIAQIDAVPRILKVVCRSTGMGFAAVARVTQDRWVACAVRDEIDFGLKPGDELEVATTICDEIRDSGQAVVIDHVAKDAVFCNHPTPRRYGFQSYISVPIRHGGQFFGTLCAIDPSPARVRDPAVIGMFELFADLIGSQLDAHERLAKSQAALLTAHESAEFRDQFIAILGHDLRNPLAAVGGGVRLLRRSPDPERAEVILSQMQHSVGRMASLIDDVMDLARGRLGGGLDVEVRHCPDLADTLTSVVAEFRIAQPERALETDFVIEGAVACDPRRVGQLLSNLVGNALTHGAKDRPVRVVGRTRNDAFELAVFNVGAPIGRKTRERLFQPFFRGGTGSMSGGLGLGLYIASEIARAHGGTLTVASEAGETCFTFAMPMPAEIAAAAAMCEAVSVD